MILRKLSIVALLAGLSFSQTACSIRGYALRATADALSGTGGGYGTEDDPELVRDAAPFGLKTMETLAEALPDHRPIRLALASGFTQYAYVFVNQEADRAEDKNIAQAKVLWTRSRRLYLRGRDYALAALDLASPGTKAAILGSDQGAQKAALAKLTKADVPYLYWCAASWALAISTAKDDANLIGDLPVVDVIMSRARELDENYDEGAIHEFYVSLDATRGAAAGGGPESAKAHMNRAIELNKGFKLGVLVSYAEGILIAQQKKAEFTQLMAKVLSTNVYSEDPSWRRNRLANIVAQQRARWLMDKLVEIFAE